MFLQHMVANLKYNGILATIMPHGGLFRGGDEKRIRAGLLENDFVKTLVGLASSMFYGTGIPSCILVLRNKGPKAPECKGVAWMGLRPQ